MSVAFLELAPGPVAHSPIERPARAAGAVLEERDGWSVAASYGAVLAERSRVAQTVGFADRSWLRKLELRIPSSQPAGGWWCPITPARGLLIGGDGPAPEGALDLTCAYVAIELAGPLAGELLSRLCAIDTRPSVLPVGGFRPGSVARTPGYVLRTGPASLLVLAGWAYGEYLWETVARAASSLGGGPVGEDAL